MKGLLRSLLFVPGSMPQRFDKAKAAGADLVCIDLEDAVLPEDKDNARKQVVEYLSGNKEGVCVRINAIDSLLGEADVAALAKVNPDYVLLAKCESVEDIKKAAGAFKGKTKVIAVIETLLGLENADHIATASEKVVGLMFGGADMAAELGCDFDFQPLLLARSQLVMAAAKAKIEVIDVPFVDFKNEQGLLEETLKVKSLGFTGKAVIHPVQVSVVHQGFMPTDKQLAYAQAVVDAVDGPDAGVVVVDGKMVDRPIILASYRMLARAKG